MAHPVNDVINKIEGREAVPCTEKCIYWRFPNRDTACCLSKVYSVKKGELCYEFTPREEEEK